MASRTPITRSIAVESKASASTGVWKQILAELEANKFSVEDIFAVHLALEEAFINAVQHGNQMDPTKEIKIAYSVASDRIEISMADEGVGFDPEAVPDPRYGENLFKPDGRGLLLMRSYMHVVEFSDSGNNVRMVRYRGSKPPLANKAGGP